MRYGSVCSGIESASVAWEPLGFVPAWFAEIEAFPSAVLDYHWPHVTNLGDMTTIAKKIRDGSVEAPDILVGGTPCQAFSVAGARAGLSDPRGQLTLSYVDIANAIDTARALRGEQPCITVWENVPGVLSSKDNAFSCFLGILAGESCELQPPGGRWKDAGCVFGPQRAVAWRILDAQYFGLAQRRRRVFVVSSAREGFDPTQVLFEWEGVRRDSAPSREAGQSVAGTLASRTGAGGFPGTDEACSGHLQPVVMATGQSGAEIRTDGGAPTLTCNHEAPIVVHGTQDPDVRIDLAHTLGSNHGQENAIAYSIRTANTSSNGWGIQKDVTHTLDTAQGLAVCITGDRTHALTAEGFDASEDGTGSGTPIIAAFAENSRSEIRFVGGDGQIAGVISTGGGKPGQGFPTVLFGMQVRRLTPVECARLQGFPDLHCSIPTAKAKKLEADEYAYLRQHHPELSAEEARRLAADGPQYKAYGNSKAVPVVRWIGERIKNYVKQVNS